METANEATQGADTAAPEAPKQRRSRARSQTWGIVVILVVMSGALALMTDSFLTTSNLLNVARQVSLITMVGVGMTFVLTTRGLDISVGAMVALGGTLAAGLAASGMPLTLAFLAAVGVAAAIGAFHAALIVYGEMSPVIVTLAGFFWIRGVAFLYTEYLTGSTAIVIGLPPNFNTLGTAELLGIPSPIWFAVVTAVAGHLLYTRFVLGRHAKALGGNPDAAYLSGISVPRTTFSVYVMVAALAGLAGVILASRLGSGQPSAGTGFEFDVIIATLIGGTSLFGGRGTVPGTVVGALIIGVLANGLNLLDVSPFWQQVVKGFVLLAAVLIDAKTRKRAD